MNAVAMQSFGFGDQLVRVHDRDGAAWFVGKDVCAALEIGNSRDALGRLEDDERDDVGITDAIGRLQRTTVISESGVYALVFTSRKEAAKRFRRWVTQEVLPAIRTTGRYQIEQSCDPSPLAGEPELEAPDDFDRIRVKLALVREVRQVFGMRAARKAWAASGLAREVTDDWQEISDVAAGAVAVVAQLHRSVASWMDERIEICAGAKILSMDLYNDYLDWCKAQEICLNDIVTVDQFGKALSNSGIVSCRGRNGRMARRGIALRPR